MGYWQQPLPSQQAGWSQQVKTVAAFAGKETNRSATTANANTLNFITISFLSKLLRDIARHTFDVRLMGGKEMI